MTLILSTTSATATLATSILGQGNRLLLASIVDDVLMEAHFEKRKLTKHEALREARKLYAQQVQAMAACSIHGHDYEGGTPDVDGENGSERHTCQQCGESFTAQF
jgi:hypothetical protein